LRVVLVAPPATPSTPEPAATPLPPRAATATARGLATAAAATRAAGPTATLPPARATLMAEMFMTADAISAGGPPMETMPPDTGPTAPSRGAPATPDAAATDTAEPVRPPGPLFVPLAVSRYPTSRGEPH
jgi:hypothetical protein